MQFVMWALAVGLLLGAAAFLAAVIDRRAGWSRIPLELDQSGDVDEYGVGAQVLRRR